MRIHWKEQFRDDFKELEKTAVDPKDLRKKVYQAIGILQEGKKWFNSQKVD